MRLAFALMLLAVTTMHAAIDFTPEQSEEALEGIKIQRLIFHENGRKISYQQPIGWTHSGSAGGIKFSPKDISQAQADISQSPLAAPQNFDEATLEALRKQVLASVPKDSQNIAIVSEERNPVMINRHESYEVTVGYQLYGHDFELSVLFLNLPDTQLKFRTVARKPDFEKVRRAFRASLFTLQWLG